MISGSNDSNDPQEKPARSFRVAIEADLFGKATTAEQELLEDDLAGWRLELVSRLDDIEGQFTKRRAAMLADGRTEKKKEYESWKSKAIGRKRAIVSRLQDVNEMLRDVARDNQDSGASFREQILAELREIRSLVVSLAENKGKP